MQGLDALWLKHPCITKIAHVCETYFEWGIKPTIMKCFQSLLWAGVVLRGLLQAALEKDQKRPDALGKTSMNNNHTIRAIHSEWCHASTDHLLEYRLEIHPSNFVQYARAGITSSCVEGDSTPYRVKNKNDNGKDGNGKNRRETS